MPGWSIPLISPTDKLMKHGESINLLTFRSPYSTFITFVFFNINYARKHDEHILRFARLSIYTNSSIKLQHNALDHQTYSIYNNITLLFVTSLIHAAKLDL